MSVSVRSNVALNPEISVAVGLPKFLLWPRTHLPEAHKETLVGAVLALEHSQHNNRSMSSGEYMSFTLRQCSGLSDTTQTCSI